jgi:Fe-S-cluster containining protein
MTRRAPPGSGAPPPPGPPPLPARSARPTSSQTGRTHAPVSDRPDLKRLFARARRQDLFGALTRIYAEFPQVSCDNCARCCFESPGLFFIEFLAALDLLAGMPRARQEQVLRRALHELFFSWVDAGRACVFLESGGCTIYEHRPLACRLFGLVAPADRDRAEAEARLAARQDAARLALLGIRIPEAVIQRSLASCDRVRDGQGRRPQVDGDVSAARVAGLDAALLPKDVVVQEFCFRSLPDRLGGHCLGDVVVEELRIQLLRRAQAGESTEELADKVRAMAHWDACLWAQADPEGRPKEGPG